MVIAGATIPGRAVTADSQAPLALVLPTVFCTPYPKDWHQRLGSGVHATASETLVQHTIWIVETGSTNMREHHAANTLP